MNGVQTQPVHQSTCQSQPAQIHEREGGARACVYVGCARWGEEWKDQKHHGVNTDPSPPQSWPVFRCAQDKHAPDHLLRLKTVSDRCDGFANDLDVRLMRDVLPLFDLNAAQIHISVHILQNALLV